MSEQNQTQSIPAEALPPGVTAEEYGQTLGATVHADPTPADVVAAKALADAPTVPDKFKNADGSVNMDAFLKSYAALENRLSTPKQEAAPAAPAAKTDQAPQPGAKIDKPAADETPSPLGDLLTSVTEAYGRGEMTDETIQPLIDAGLPKQTIDIYFEGLQALETLTGLRAAEAAGGQAAFDTMRKWAETGLNDADLEVYNGLAGSPRTVSQAIALLKGRYDAANPNEGRMIENTSAGPASGDVYGSRDEMTAAMRSPEYAASASFRQQVAEKLRRSIVAGSMQSLTEYSAG